MPNKLKLLVFILANIRKLEKKVYLKAHKAKQKAIKDLVKKIEYDTNAHHARITAEYKMFDKQDTDSNLTLIELEKLDI